MNFQKQDHPYMVFKKEYNGKPLYSIGISKKNINGEYTNGYVPVQFKSNVEVDNQTKIYIENAWLTFYIDKNNKTIPYIFINEFREVQEESLASYQSVKQDEIVLTDDDLPF